MKVVLFCGGLGTRLREHSEVVPKPLVNIGIRPLIWHLMRYYAHFGHKEFILALGYKGDMIREYFLNYEEALSHDFTLTGCGRQGKIQLHDEDSSDWKITFVDTGMHCNLGQRLLRIRKFLGDDPVFLANYSDGLSDLPLNAMVSDFMKSDAVASMVSARSSQSFHVVRSDDHGRVLGMGAMNGGEYWINGGFFILRQEIFDYLNEGEELVEQPFERLIQKGRLMTHRYEGFWQAMDTFKDKITFDRMEARGNCPWMIWKKPT